ncbi:hypothetical protein PF005_g9755 [Phytophthora fragariae]|uniref:Nitroreductase domain-containing protein n=1 Tax=Phytophthora fragariae TaxID=53985 RepID=A0A6A3FJJ1_9STRA|nr:hypothetical protein PF003_g23696 [Phytophthora fragariae]KAE8945955.1 hypothetical protein PF009_g4415 [Phytophthora fragariae]KAE8996669.1 hypothetical protein PF011_g15810 [Phytophthora fragariae]KAE9081098.1 hypothetical protein PF010_g22120 [Phytophthora fragariae]KAE9104561.1 hypothetical protein PF006_g21876 [Phytophthora fragariae]
MHETATTLAVVSTASSLGLALYALKLRAELEAGKKTVKTVTKTTVRNASGDKLWTAEQLIAERRSVFPPDYDSARQVPRAVLDKMLEAANWAPTHGRTEPWRFVVFEAPEKRLELGELLAGVYKSKVPADKFLETKYKKMVFNCTASSHVIAICMKRQKSGKIPEWEELCSVACAVQNMHLVATAHGVGAYWSSGPPITMSQEMKDHLSLGEEDKCLGLFYVGVIKADAKIAKGARKPIAEKVTWVA